MRTWISIGVIATLCGVTALAIAGGDWSKAERKTEEFKREEKDLRKLTSTELQGVVRAICEAEEDSRKSVGADASRRVKDKVACEYSSLERIQDEAHRLLDEVIADSALKARHSKAGDYKKDLTKYWSRIGRMTKSVRGANHPIVAYLLDEGNKAHRSYQSNSSKCDVSEFSMSSGRADCIKAGGSTCTVIELKPDNSRAIRLGKGQARRYAEELDKRGDAFKRLVGKDRDFAKCERFEFQVDCYKLCPDIDEAGKFDKASPSWRSDCR